MLTASAARELNALRASSNCLLGGAGPALLSFFSKKGRDDLSFIAISSHHRDEWKGRSADGSESFRFVVPCSSESAPPGSLDGERQ